jgi:rRNA-processing protein FCF1
MKYKVIFDTNSIRNAESVADFLGGRAELERFLKVSEIIIPDIVIEEIKNQKRKHLISKRDSFLSNPFHFLRKINEEETKSFDIEKWITDLVDEESVPHTVIFLTKDNVLDEIKKLCLANLPPFEENCDKGFKDAYIYFTILEYLECIDGENVFVVTNDDRLRMAFDNNPRVIVVKNFDEFEKYIDSYFREEYFINRLKEEVSGNITTDCIEGIWLNTNENWVIKILCDEKTYFVEVDFSTREIIGFTDFDFSTFVRELVNSGSFANTHSMISSLSEYVQYFSNQDIIDLIGASTENSQIYSISTDEDVKEFFTSLSESKSQIITDEDVAWRFKQVFKQE